MSMFARSLKALTIEKKKCVDMAELKKKPNVYKLV